MSRKKVFCVDCKFYGGNGICELLIKTAKRLNYYNEKPDYTTSPFWKEIIENCKLTDGYGWVKSVLLNGDGNCKYFERKCEYLKDSERGIINE